MRLARSLSALAAAAFLLAAPLASAVAADFVLGDGVATITIGSVDGLPMQIAPKVPDASSWDILEYNGLALANSGNVDVSWIGKWPGTVQNTIQGNTITTRSSPTGLGGMQIYFTEAGTNGLYGGQYKGLDYVDISLAGMGANQSITVMTSDYQFFDISGSDLAAGSGHLYDSQPHGTVDTLVSQDDRADYRLLLDGTKGGGIIMVSMMNWSNVDDASITLNRISSVGAAAPAPAPLPALAGTPFGIAAVCLFVRRRKARALA